MRVISVGVHRPLGEKCGHMVMNTTEKNTLGRTIYKGPRGGLYVLGPTGSKIRTFKKAPARSPPPAPPAPPKNTLGRVIHTGVRGGRYVLDGTRKIYKFTPAAATGGPVVRRRSPGTRSPTSAERNARLLEIRRRLNNLRRERLARVPAGRANVNRRLRNVLGRVRERIAPRVLTGPVTTMDVEFCHSVASVPRKPCRRRKVRVRFHDSPLINSGVVVSTRRKDIDQEWITRQDKYIKQLNDYDFWTAQAHTNRSHAWIGPYLYGSGRLRMDNLPGARSSSGGTAHMAPLWPQVRKLILDGTFVSAPGHTWVQTFLNTTSEPERYNLYDRERNNVPDVIRRRALDMYRADLKRIIGRAPRSKKTMVIYRGTGFDIFKGSTSHWHTLKSFCSAAYDLQWALRYESGYVQRITILPGTPVLFVAGMNQWHQSGEYEIMVNVDTKYLIRYRNVKRSVDDIDRGSRTRKIKITDVTIAK
jgi:hypothetical protein